MGLRCSGPACCSPIEIKRNLMKSKRLYVVISISARAALRSRGACRPMTGYYRPTGGSAKFSLPTTVRRP
jgi:hypothetical protein